MGVMANTPKSLLDEIEAFLSARNMSASYFGKKAVGNSEVVARLRNGRRVWPETETKIRSFILSEKINIRNSGYVNASRSRQDRHTNAGER